MIGIIIFVIFILLVVFVAIKENRDDSRKFESDLKDDEKWLKEELTKPLSRIAFITSNNKTLYGKGVEPYNTCAGSRQWFANERVTSKDRANKVLNAWHERGYFTDEDGVTYPACNILSAKVEANEAR